MDRALVARANYISQDRTDIMYATKELSRGMSRPTVGNLKSLKRLARYLKGKKAQSWSTTTNAMTGT